jgi:hypothetical protein
MSQAGSAPSTKRPSKVWSNLSNELAFSIPSWYGLHAKVLKIIEKAFRGEKVSARALLKDEPLPTPSPESQHGPGRCGFDNEEIQLRKLEAAWNEASDVIRTAFAFEVLGLEPERAYSLHKKRRTG